MRAGLRNAILAGGITAATLDILYAFVLWGFRGVSPVTILQSVASGLLGNSTYDGGAATALLGGVLHYLIACTMAAAYVLAGTRVSALVRKPFLWGPVYGVFLYCVMNYVVLPLSAFPPGGSKDAVTVVTGVLVHAFLIGLPIAWFANKALGKGEAPRAGHFQSLRQR